MGGTVRVALALAVGLGLGFAGGVLREKRVSRNDHLTTGLGHELETAGTCALALGAASPERSAALLEKRLDGAIWRAVALLDQGARLEIPAPHLLESVRRAGLHYAATGDAERKRRTEALLADLQPAP